MDIEAQQKSETNLRKLDGFWRKLFKITAISMTLFHLIAASFVVFPAFLLRSVHIGFVFILVFLLFGATKKSKKVNALDLVLMVLGVISMIYIAVNHEVIAARTPWVYPASPIQIMMAFIAILVILEVSRRSIGIVLPLLAVIFLLYGFLGPYLPGALAHGGMSFSKMVDQMYLSFEGIFGIAIAVSASYIFLFLVFGSFLDKSGAGEFFMDLSRAIAGGYKGGPAKIAVFSSALMGAISGSATANVVTTGTFTIPMMKRTGFKKEFAAAVETVASTGGQIMPPLMGAGAFIMAEYLGIPYLKVAYHALVPAILYFLAVGIMIHFESCKLNLPVTPRSELPNIVDVLKSGFLYFIPLIAIIWFLLKGFTPAKAGFYATIMIFLISLVNKKTRMGLDKVLYAMEAAAKNSISLVAACACAGIIVGIVRATGLGFKFGSFIVSISDGALMIALLLGAITGIIMGMGLPTTPSYVIQAALAVPALIQLGVEPIAAHLFCFYFACLACITPPVAVAAYAAAPLAEANAVTVGFIAFRLGIAAFIIPFIFAYAPELILIGESMIFILFSIVTALFGVVGLAACTQGWLLGKTQIWERIVMGISAITLIKPGYITDTVGIVLFVIVLGAQYNRFRNKKEKIKNQVAF
ncbi:MAG: TRAP transporter permease [Dehalobacterium sp.]